MAFTEKDMEEQDRVIADLREELSLLNARFDGLLRDLGLSEDDLDKLPDKDLPPELAAALTEAEAQAVRAGRERAGQADRAFKSGVQAGRGRPGAVLV
ncbi:MAG: hypothetical protein LBQ51_08895 [Desulfovibrio sp.]|jgi:hypothetical protein|nr:hypothetical protein [Desulfovibrio sp.]